MDVPVIEVEGLRKTYGEKVAVDEVSFAVERGEIFGILGSNGAGKTTTVECVEGLRVPDRGRVSVLGLDPWRDTAELRQRLGIQSQASEMPDKLRVWEALDLYASFYRRPADPERLLDRLGLVEQRDTHYRTLSGGQKQRLSIALALIGDPEVAVLDELTAGLDPASRRETWDLVEQIRDQGVTILLVTHFMAEAERLCDRLAVIDAGRVIALDTPAGLVAAVDDGQRVTFRPSAPVADEFLTDLPEVRAVERHGGHLVVSGRGNVLHAVTAALASRQIVAEELRVQRADLDDAFVALTGRALD